MNIGANKARLRSITRDLLVEWRNTRETWRDGKAQQFERDYIDELTTGTEQSMAVIAKLEEIVHHIRKDCE
jgi:hypothetical protein